MPAVCNGAILLAFRAKPARLLKSAPLEMRALIHIKNGAPRWSDEVVVKHERDAVSNSNAA